MLAWFEKYAEVIVVVLLGLVSVSTAYASFQASLYDSKMFQEYAVGQNVKTEAESIYLEANQQFVQDAQTLVKLDEIAVEMQSGSPEVAALATEKYASVYYGSVSDVFAEAIDRADALNASGEGDYVSPQDDEAYLDDLFGVYWEKNAEVENRMAMGDNYNALGDKLTLYTVLMALSLFLLGVAAVVKRVATKFSIAAIAMVIFTFTAILTAFIPFMPID